MIDGKRLSVAKFTPELELSTSRKRSALGALAAGHDARALSRPDLDVVADLLELAQRGLRPDLGAIGERVADADRGRAPAHSLLELLAHVAVHERARRGHAGLARGG